MDSKKEKRKFIIILVDAFFKFLGKFKVVCCNSSCMIDKSVNCPENNINDNDIDDKVFID